MHKFFPFLLWTGAINAQSLRADFLAGLTGAVIVLPQGVAFAMIAGMPPINGLYTAMILPIVAALLGSSRHLISGPTTPISLVVYSTVSQYAAPATPDFIMIAITITLVTGVIQLVLGLAKMGAVVNFISHSVVIGFTAGAAILIATSQVKHFLGLDLERSSSFPEAWTLILQSLNQTNFYALAIALVTLASAILVRRLHPLVPHMLIAMIIGSILSFYMAGPGNGVAVIGELPKGLPPFSLPNFEVKLLQNLTPNAFAIALLGLIEAVAIARAIATKTGQRIDANQEFIGQGLSNIAGSFFSCYAGSGSFTRSGVNHSAGAVTPMSAVFAAVLLMFLIVFIGHLTVFLPMPAMAGIIVLVAYNLIDFHHIKKILKTSRRESLVMVITFGATLFLELEYAIYLGVFFSLVFYLRKTSTPRMVKLAPDPKDSKRMFKNAVKYDLDICPQLMVYRIEGSLFFGAVEHVGEKLDVLLDSSEKNLLIVGNNINLIDTSGAEFLTTIVRKWEERGKKIYLSGLKLRARTFLKKGGYWDEIGEDRFFVNKEEAIAKIYSQLDQHICEKCPFQIFRECPRAGSEYKYSA